METKFILFPAQEVVSVLVDHRLKEFADDTNEADGAILG